METPPTKRARLRQFWNDHVETIVPITFVTGFVGVIVALAVKDYKDQNTAIDNHNKKIRELNTWFNDEHNSGNNVYVLADGRALKVPQNTPQETVIL